jgi:hypothetical protein
MSVPVRQTKGDKEERIEKKEIPVRQKVRARQTVALVQRVVRLILSGGR